MENLEVNMNNIEKIINLLHSRTYDIKYEKIILDVSYLSNDYILNIIKYYKENIIDKSYQDNINKNNNVIKQILIVDDDMLSIELVKDAILSCKKKNILIDYCTDVDIFLVGMYTKIANINLLLLDINFGFNKENGLNILKKIREYEIDKGISYWDDNKVVTTKESLKIIIMTSSLELEKSKIVYQYGARFINKIFISQSYIRTMLNMLIS